MGVSGISPGCSHVRQTDYKSVNILGDAYYFTLVARPLPFAIFFLVRLPRLPAIKCVRTTFGTMAETINLRITIFLLLDR